MAKHFIRFSIFCFLLSAFLFSSYKIKSKITEIKNKVEAGMKDTVVVEKDDYYDKDYFRYEDYIYNDSIKTVLLHKKGSQLTHPVIKLNDDEQLKLSFDDLDAPLKYYYYTVIHCNADWKSSDLIPSEYIDGFTQDNITDYKFSGNTIQHYIHYNLVFPNANMQITKSGNYIIKVYVDDNTDDVILTKRFMVTEEKVKISANIKQATTINDRDYKQEIDFNIIPGDYQLTNPYSDLKVVIMQNFRWDNVITELQPQFVKEDVLSYDYDEENVFVGGNEYRYFEMINLQFHNERIRNITYESDKNHVYLYADKKRSFRVYLSRPDINGKRFIRTTEGIDSEIDADYAYVHFILPYIEPIVEGNLYVFGALSNWGFSEEYKMKYNYNMRAYERPVYLKQGYYNYEYVLLKDETATADNTYIEGSHYETENDYTILVYHRATGTNYDQLIAIDMINSRRDE